MNLLLLFINFCKFGLLCFGGGYMLVPLLTAEFVGDGKLLTPERFGNLISVSQLTPGPVGINTATFVGYLSGNFWGALTATLGLVFPTLFLAGLAMKFIIRYREHRLMQGILYGARLGAAALVVYAVLIFMQLSLLKSPWTGFWQSWQPIWICPCPPVPSEKSPPLCLYVLRYCAQAVPTGLPSTRSSRL